MPVALNVKGSTTLTSIPGLFATFVMWLVILAYLAQRFQILVYKLYPTVTESHEYGFQSSTDKINVTDLSFRIAWAVESYDKQRVGKDDPDFVSWFPAIKTNVGGVSKYLPLSFHKCNKTDYDSFFPPRPSSID